MAEADSSDVIFHDEAAEEYLAARRWYSERASPEIADAFQHALDQVLKRIAEAPRRWPVYHEVYRCVQLQRFPYLVIYEPMDDGRIYVIAVAHASRKPKYWLDRQ